MNIYVCLKQVPDTNTHLKLLPEGKGIEESSIEWIINPYDEFALETAFRIREKKGEGLISVLSLGPARAEKVLRTALAMGADTAYLLESNITLDPLITSQCLAGFLSPKAPDLVLTGKSSIDNNYCITGSMLAEIMQIQQVNSINHIEETTENCLLCRRNMPEGGCQEIKLKTPFLASIDKGEYQPRYPSLPGIMKAKKKPLHKIPLAVDLKPRFHFHSYSLPNRKIQPQIFSGTAEEQVKQLIKILKEKIL